MAAEATVNVRIPATLKSHGDAVLKQRQISVSALVRRLYSYMEATGEIPVCLMEQGNEAQEMQRKRQLLQGLCGILPSDVTLEEAREARFASHGL